MSRYFVEERTFTGREPGSPLSELQTLIQKNEGVAEVTSLQKLDGGHRLWSETQYEWWAKYLILWRFK